MDETANHHSNPKARTSGSRPGRPQDAQDRSETHQFGSWKVAIQQAGFDYETIRLTRQWPRERIIKRLKQIARDGGDLSEHSAEAWGGSFVAAAVAKFGSWDKALKAAKVASARRTVRWSRSRILEAIRHNEPSTHNAGLRKAAARNFGSWKKAMQAAGKPTDHRGSVRCTVRKHRRAAGLSLEAVGKAMGYSHRAISMIELGQWPDPRVSVALKLARALKVPVERLFQANGKKASHATTH